MINRLYGCEEMLDEIGKQSKIRKQENLRYDKTKRNGILPDALKRVKQSMKLNTNRGPTNGENA